METELSNITSSVGTYNNIPTEITSFASVVTMLNGLTITKTADKEVWADGNLTYTIVVDNKTEKAYATPVITDILDNNLITFVEDSITINDVKATSSEYTYNQDTNTLTINLTDIEPNNSTTIKFQVSKK